MYRVGVIGHGFVGVALDSGLQAVLGIECRIHDKFKSFESLDAVVDNSDILFVALPTPMNFDTGECDLSIINEVLADIDKIATGKSIVIKSTVPPGSTAAWAKRYPEQNFIFCPEFLTEKTFIEDFINQDRIILGTTSALVGVDNSVLDLFINFSSAQKMRGTTSKIKVVDSGVAEMVKYMGNCMLATKVIFCNEIAEICKASDIDYSKVADLVSLDKRIGSSHMTVPGHDGSHGFGGSCFSKDLNSLMFFAKEHGVDPLILDSVWTKNLLVREVYDWEKLAQVTGKYTKKENE